MKVIVFNAAQTRLDIADKTTNNLWSADQISPTERRKQKL